MLLVDLHFWSFYIISAYENKYLLDVYKEKENIIAQTPLLSLLIGWLPRASMKSKKFRPAGGWFNRYTER